MANFIICICPVNSYFRYCSTVLSAEVFSSEISYILGRDGEIAPTLMKKHLQSQMVGGPQISAILLLLQPVCGCTGH